MMLRKNVEKRQMFKQLDGVFLAVDEICDGGIIMEVEPQVNLILLRYAKSDSLYSKITLSSCEQVKKIYSTIQI